ncbi:MAG: hypothetical protein AAGA86_08560 [Bacteroidota bacterium]
MRILSLIALAFAFFHCSKDKGNTGNMNDESPSQGLRVTSVSVSGNANEYTFSVTLASPDTGCDQYADWWEVIDGEGNLVYRRILAHSHVNEQPFTRSGGPVRIGAATQVYVRGHMNNSGYSDQVWIGSAEGGFTAGELDTDFAQELEDADPLPSGCTF